MRVVIVTGLNGSGKSTALRALEDLGYYAIDNLPITLLDRLIDLFRVGDVEIKKLALVADARGAHGLEQIPEAIDHVREHGHEVELLFLEASDEVVARRYSETRRRHPLAESVGLDDAIARDRMLLEPLRAAATRMMDTSGLSVHDLKREVNKQYGAEGDVRGGMGISLMSFGYRHGVPHEADLVFDVRFLPNPYFVEDLRPLTGADPECSAYVLERTETQSFFSRLKPLLEFLLPEYEREGKAYLTIAIGCTGGRHRSVAVTESLAVWLRSAQREAHVRHRDTPSAGLPGDSGDDHSNSGG